MDRQNKLTAYVT